MFCLHRSNCIYTVYMKLVRTSFECLIFLSQYFQLPSSDEMEMFYTKHDFQVQLEISCRENTTLSTQHQHIIHKHHSTADSELSTFNVMCHEVDFPLLLILI